MSQGKPAGKPPKAILLDVQWEAIKKLMHKKPPHIVG
jgi:DTW domain-containing protein YfiP